MPMDVLASKEIPRLSIDKIVSIFGKEDQDAYLPGLLIGDRCSKGTKIENLSFVHPFSIDAFILVLCIDGTATISTNISDFTLQPRSLYINFPGQIMSLASVDNCRVKVVAVDLEFIRTMNLDIKPVAQKLLDLKYAQQMELSDSSFAESISLVDAIYYELINNGQDSVTNDILRCLLAALFLKIGRAIDANQSGKLVDQDAFNKNAGYFKEFMIILSQNFKKERSVGFYAEQMHLSPKYFTTLIKRASGQTAAEWINHYVILEAKNLLKYSTMNVQEIAYSLNFPNQSFFGKYFKHHTGMTPSEYKRL